MCAGAGRRRRFRKVPQGSGVCWCRFWREVPEGFGRCWRVPENSGVLAEVAGRKGSGRFGEVPERSGHSRESRARRRLWRVLLAYEQNNAPMCRFEIDKANAHDTAMYALLLGIPPELIVSVFILGHFWEAEPTN